MHRSRLGSHSPRPSVSLLDAASLTSLVCHAQLSVSLFSSSGEIYKKSIVGSIVSRFSTFLEFGGSLDSISIDCESGDTRQSSYIPHN